MFGSIGELASGVDLTQDEAKSLKYATILASFNNSSGFTMVMGYLNSNSQDWFNRNLAGLRTSHGRMLHLLNTHDHSDITVTFSDELMNWSWKKFIADKKNVHSDVKIDFLANNHFGVSGTLGISLDGMEERQYLDQTVSLLRVKEHLLIPSLNFAYDNFYWVDPSSGFVWQSLQKWGPDTTELYYQVAQPWLDVEWPK
ncbi:YjbF family lipoprotein [Thiomicrorhabdus heinhorstiae]|uniref:YjbF family lipoprotein n=1 Tax=Thiomicrorhabdus heinhorstiae TaxID=2748010 RepID=A0ABS0BTU6_9GAMM|nr:YjbF family lipoprotein [Thiomicrorhabdus heinhorstiae]MBF6057267.1 YjbF family lipoprotein [Thiomicrorhabdus heinhorstiae]